MHKLLKEVVKVYTQFQKLGPTYLDTFDNRAITEATFEAVKTKQLQEYVKKEFKPIGDVSMLPIHLEPEHRFTIAMFALRPGVRMPLHDHPNMFVLSHVMNGLGEREAWDVDPIDHHQQIEFRRNKGDSRIVKGIQYPKLQLKEGDNCYTTPNKCNLHKFSNIHESELFIFLDVILPHYNGVDRVINFYEPFSEDQLELMGNPKTYQRHPIDVDDIREFIVQ
ncbi:unnamed protein product (macronuclear) [Paramecium tetraurelia]|uniref:Cysteine dioxygenase n=1 Tax=Paramecium tetraurelia TaxID=5888 RepID=A0C9R4_PARTE|nr:uncharacterized protein GSPATT00006838001 [Paramecium tetraurelia]CAK67531.1 unnamed protein product [Paramecium tetraurelia]|eukprot:XP_001434928.1 hypothetical protein (macronuclear) [Paramecium tetraurelia strain d4-2]